MRQFSVALIAAALGLGAAGAAHAAPATYKIDGVPALGIHGRFYTSPALAGGEGASEIQGQTRALALTDQLVASLRKG